MKLILSLVFLGLSIVRLQAQVPPNLSFDPDYDSILSEKHNKEKQLLSTDAKTKDLFIIPSPNPVQNKMKLDAKLKDSDFQIFDLNGQSVISGTIVFETIDMSALENGLYILVIQTTSNQIVKYKFTKLN